MNEATHPARSSEFLSRLHDGDATAAERHEFDSHLTSCEECRRAVELFERAIAVFRAAPTASPAPDLSARILRRIRAQTPSRRPFGVMFGIDVRWAGVLVAALLALIFSAPLLLRRTAPTPLGEPASPISARILDATPAGPSGEVSPPRGDRREAARPAPASRVPASAPAPTSAPAEAKDEKPAAPSADAPNIEDRRDSASAQFSAKAIAPGVRRQEAAPEPSDGESGAASNARAAGSAPGVQVRPADGEGPPPALLSRPPGERLEPLRGLEFVVMVEAGGRVREVLPSSSGELTARRAAETAEPQKRGEQADPLRDLVFAPGNRPRRLLVRVE